MENEIEVARRFSEALDGDRFLEALSLLADECSYLFRGEVLSGSKDIIATYEANSVRGKGLLDELSFSSRIEEKQDEKVSVLFTDVLRKGHRSITLQSRQLLQIKDGKIIHIEHCDIDGEPEKLALFFESTGIQWE